MFALPLFITNTLHNFEKSYFDLDVTSFSMHPVVLHKVPRALFFLLRSLKKAQQGSLNVSFYFLCDGIVVGSFRNTCFFWAAIETTLNLVMCIMKNIDVISIQANSLMFLPKCLIRQDDLSSNNA